MNNVYRQMNFYYRVQVGSHEPRKKTIIISFVVHILDYFGKKNENESIFSDFDGMEQTGIKILITITIIIDEKFKHYKLNLN